MASYFLDDYVNEVYSRLGLESMTHMEKAGVERQIQAAVAAYSGDNPQVVFQSYTGDGTNRYTLPTSWSDNFSIIRRIEYPAGEDAPVYLKPNRYGVINNGTSAKIQLYTINPGSSDTFVVEYTAPHTLTATTSTIADGDYRAVVNLSTSFTCMAVASILLRTRDSRISADSLNLRTASDEYKAMAKEYYELYRTMMGIPKDGPRPADAIGDIDLPSKWPYPYLVHTGR